MAGVQWKLVTLCLCLTCLCCPGSLQFCYTRPGCVGMPRGIAVNGKDCCSQHGVSFFKDNNCYLLQCLDFKGKCQSRSVSGRQEFDCLFSYQPVSTVCSFDGGRPGACSFPLAVDVGEFGTGLHSVVVTVINVFGTTLDLTFNFRLHGSVVPHIPGSSSSLVSTESDRDGDGVPDDSDNCRHHSNRSQKDTDLDGVGNVCDNCPYDHNPDQQNSDADFMGDECDSDDDNDGVGDGEDNCPLIYNPLQEDADNNSIGDACDTCSFMGKNDSHSIGDGRLCSTQQNNESGAGVVYVGLEKSVYLVSEGGQEVKLCAVVNLTDSDCAFQFSFNISLSLGTKREVICANGLANTSLSLSFGPCDERACVDLPLEDDDIAEEVKSFPIVLERTPHLDDRIKLDPFIGELIIFDNDDMEVGFAATEYVADGASGRVAVCVEVLNPPSGGAIQPFIVALLPEKGKEKECSLGLSRRLHFVDGQSRVCTDYNTTTSDGCALQGNATQFEVRLSLVSTTRLQINSNFSTARITVADSGISKSYVEVGYEQTSYTISDVDNSVEVCVNSSLQGDKASFVINITTYYTADATEGFLKQSNETLYFSPNVSNRFEVQCYNISANFDVDDVCEQYTNCSRIQIVSELVKVHEDDNVTLLEGRSTAKIFIEVPNECNCSVLVFSSTVVHKSVHKAILIAATVPSSVLFIVAVITLIVVIVMCVICRKRIQQTKGYVAIERKTSSIKFLSVERTKRSVLSSQLSKEHRGMIFSRNQLEISGSIDEEGESGLVYKAYLTTKVKKEMVAVKNGKAIFSRRDMKLLAKEVSAMLSFENTNIMSLIGICIEGEMPLLIMPFMANGSVLEFVKYHREELLCRSASTEQQVTTARNKLLHVCQQIASGMRYLAAHKFVHRNLAARNCMIDSFGVIKVADFFRVTEDIIYGTSYDREKGVSGNEEKVPIRWMAPESIEEDIYTEATDVWSFGVTVWEIFTCGRTPYSGVPAMGLLRELQRGQRLERPHNQACCVQIFEVMMLCLSLEQRLRPKFRSLVSRLGGLGQRESGYPEMSQYLCWKESTSSQLFRVTFVPTL